MAIDSSRVNLIMTQSVLGPYFLAVDSLDVTHPALAGVRNTPLGSSLALWSTTAFSLLSPADRYDREPGGYLHRPYS